MSIFINYRRNDSADVTGRIYDRLAYSFAKDLIFKDVDSIPFGVNFKTYLNDIIEKSQILLVVIGPNWLNVTNELGERRLDDPSDYVRIEIEIALRRKITIVPLLVSGASMPKASQLPSSLEELAFYNGTQIRPDPDFHKDMNRLIHELGNQIKPTRREGTKHYYPGSDFSENPTTGNLLNRSPVETLTIAKGKVTDFIDFLPTPLGRLFIGVVLGGIVSLLLSGTLLSGLTLSFGILGLVIYPHRKTVLYVVSGIVLVIAFAFLMAFLTDSSEIIRSSWPNYIFNALYPGIILGVIVSRIQHIRKKI